MLQNGNKDYGRGIIRFERNPKLKHVYFSSLETIISSSGLRVISLISSLT